MIFCIETLQTCHVVRIFYNHSTSTASSVFLETVAATNVPDHPANGAINLNRLPIRHKSNMNCTFCLAFVHSRLHFYATCEVDLSCVAAIKQQTA